MGRPTKESSSIDATRRKLGIDKQNANFSAIMHRETSLIFLERFAQRLASLLRRTYTESEAKDILSLMKSEKLKIMSPESFLFKWTSIGDESLKIYNTVKDIDEFFFKAIMAFRKRAEDGETDIIIREFFLVVIDMYSSKNLEHDKLVFYLKYFIFTITNLTHPSPFTIQLLEPHLLKSVKQELRLNLTNYNSTYACVLASLKKLMQKNSLTQKEAYFPKVEIVFPVDSDVRYMQILYLRSIFGLEFNKIETMLRSVKSLSERTPELEVALERILQKCGLKNFDIESTLVELNRIEEMKPLKTYPFKNYLYKGANSFVEYKNVFKDKRIQKVFAYGENYAQTFQPYKSNIIIDCYKKTEKSIEKYIDAAKNLSLVKGVSRAAKMISKSPIHKKLPTAYKITFNNVTEFSKDFLKFIEAKMEQIRSVTNQDFIYEIRYYDETAYCNLRHMKSKNIRIISDVHVDVNRKRNHIFNFGDDFVINCGDTAGDAITCRDWNRTHIVKGVVVLGNHLGYSPSYPELNDAEHVKSNYEMYGHPTHVKNTKNEQIYQVGVALTGISTPRVMSNSETEYEGIKILGSTLYTDFALYGKDHIEESMAYAQKHMNDFKLIKVAGHREYQKKTDGSWTRTLKARSKSQIRLFTPQDHAYYFSYSLAYLKEKVLEYKKKPIIIATHHAPSPYCISPQYEGNLLNPAFASNLNEFIIANPQIRLWCFGHTHSSCDFILGETRVICEPFGYGNENGMESKLPFDYGKKVAIKDIKSKKSWKTICAKEIKEGLIKVYEK